MNPEVLVVGAGPVGLTMAALLTQYGLRVRIIDKGGHRSDKSKALVLWSRTLELLDASGCAAQLIAAGHAVTSANIISGNQLIGHVSLADVESVHPYALMLPQSETERLLEEHLARQGVTVERQLEAVAFSADASGVKTRVRGADAREQTIESEWLIGCDGAHSVIRHGLGFSFLGDTLQSDWLLADLHLTRYPFADSEIAVYWHEKGVLVILPIKPGRYRVIADLPIAAAAHPAQAPRLDQVQAILEQRGPSSMVASNPMWLATFRINERKVDSYRSGRVFLAGDAAHIHSPAGGQGMNTGLQDAVNLAWKLALVQHKEAAAGLLDSYSLERSRIGGEVIETAGRLTQIATLRRHTAQALRNWVGRIAFGLAPVRHELADNLTELSVGYRTSPLNGPGARGIARPKPGERVAPRDGERPIGAGAAPRFALCCEASAAVATLVAKYPDLLEPEIRPALHEGGMWLVRPDGYVACVAKSPHIEVVSDYLDAIQSKGGHLGLALRVG